MTTSVRWRARGLSSLPCFSMWSGIAAAADGKLYCSPANASRVLRIDPATGATELIGDDLKDKGLVASLLATAASRVLRIAATCDRADRRRPQRKMPGGRPSRHFGYAWLMGTRRLPQDWVFLASNAHPLATGATELFGDDKCPITEPPVVCGRWSLAGEVDGQLYCMPSDATCVLRIDLATGKSEVIGKLDKSGTSPVPRARLVRILRRRRMAYSTALLRSPRACCASPSAPRPSCWQKAPCSGRLFKPKWSIAASGQHIDSCTVGIN